MPEIGNVMDLPERRPEITAFLQSRRSNMAKAMDGPGPSDAQLRELLSIAARVPDHRKLAPWRFVLFQGDARADIGQHIGALFAQKNTDMPVDRVLFESQRFLRAPLIVGVVSSPVKCPRGTPEWEQILSSGAVCYNLLIAAQAAGFAAQWLTEWYSYERDILTVMGLDESERIAGFLYIGSAKEPSLERVRPDLDEKITSWSAS